MDDHPQHILVQFFEFVVFMIIFLVIMIFIASVF